ncbi:hypothetical protein O3P69_011090 [Scylla paramamosain]|uniref:Uncharacterized protein n=1 Tax=Scylla paramamosain TaxID=85552 RepID=A0AAW0SUC7_SCYPA
MPRVDARLIVAQGHLVRDSPVLFTCAHRGKHGQLMMQCPVLPTDSPRQEVPYLRSVTTLKCHDKFKQR